MQDLFSKLLVTRLATEIERHRQHVKTTPDRQARLSALEDMIELIDNLSKLAGTKALAATPAFREGSLSRLAELMSSKSIEEVAGSVAWTIDEREISYAFERRGRGNVHFMDVLTRAARQAVGVQIGPMLLTRLLDRMKTPLEEALQLERINRGDRPALIYRNFLVQELVKDYHARTGTLPPKAKSGPFIEACHDILLQLKVDPKGLEAAIERAINELKA